MKTILKTFFIILTTILSIGCATNYNVISPPNVNYSAQDNQDSVELLYKYDVLREVGNKRYAKKEDQKGIRIVAVKITNKTDSTIVIGQDFAFFSNKKLILPIDPLIVKNTLKQSVPSYLLYILLTPINFYVTNGRTVDNYPIGLILGPTITVGNMMVANTANSKMYNELKQFDIMNKSVKKGETIYGIIGISDHGFNPIILKRINK